MDGARGILSTSAGRTLRGKGQQTIQPGEHFIMEMPGGGGLGHPFKRDPARVAADVTLGLVSPDAALRDYGVVLRADGSVDTPATDKQRGTATTATATAA